MCSHRVLTAAPLLLLSLWAVAPVGYTFAPPVGYTFALLQVGHRGTGKGKVIAVDGRMRKETRALKRQSKGKRKR